MRKSVRIGEVCGFESECASVPIHLLNKVFHRLVRRYPSLIHIILPSTLVFVILIWTVGITLAIFVFILFLLCVDLAATYCRCNLLLTVLFIVFVSGGHFEQILSKMLCQTYTSIISTRKHQPMQ